MDLDVFENQMRRLESQWPKSYGNERKLTIWQAVAKHPNDFMRCAVDHFLETYAKAPMPRDFEKFVPAWEGLEFSAKKERILESPELKAEADWCKQCKEVPEFPGLIFKKSGVVRCSCPLGELHPDVIPRVAKPKKQEPERLPYKDD